MLSKFNHNECRQHHFLFCGYNNVTITKLAILIKLARALNHELLPIKPLTEFSYFIVPFSSPPIAVA
ncbi:hypothetical protein RSOLAG1IB_08807 [Rhizoctonia solani AG-1 IB]|uniref:Uncharacterized protein n=1 Tax=Thanatephorus cucumeris (strain AG1-IB / isolate 7/3/14) TaxID=1108050 RepID=A0A0B7FLC7_THACB|nr:hypothetical protein RSOLAG1IB_08807 [Rhizoctonia solani AG-1 IB]